MTNIFRFLLLIMLSFFIHVNHAHTAMSRYAENGKGIKTEKKNPTTTGILTISNLNKNKTRGIQKDKSSLTEKERKAEHKMSRKSFGKDQSCLGENEKIFFKNLIEAEKHLKFLLRERDVLVGDFYGVNLTAYRYINIFHRLGYIRYRILQIDKEIRKLKFKISLMKKRSRK